MLGGKGANQAVALAQLGVPVALVGVVGDDRAGDQARAQAAADGIDVTAVVRRTRSSTALLLDLVEDGGRRRLVESVPDAVLPTEKDVRSAGGLLAGAAALVLQLQTRGAAVRAALDAARSDALVVADGAPEDAGTRAAVLGRADVVRADAREAAQLVGHPIDGVEAVRTATRELLDAGPRLVALGAAGDGDLVAWVDGELLLPLLGEDPVDPTGAGDSYVAALTAALLGGAAPEDAAWFASSAAALCVTRAGGRPALSPDALRSAVHRFRGP